MGQCRAVGVVAAFITFNFDARKAILINGKACDLNFTQVSFTGMDVKRCERARSFKGGNVIVRQVYDVT